MMSDVTPYFKSPRKRRKSGLSMKTRRILEERCGGRCEARGHGDCVCSGRYENAHHKRRRSQGGSDEPDNLLCVCLGHHRWIHDNPEAAVELGFLIPSGPISTAVRSVTKVDR